MSEIVLYVSAGAFTCYIIAIVAVFGIPPSVSESFYLLNAKKKDLGYLFTLWCYLVGITAVILMLSLSEHRWFQFTGFFAGAALCFVGTAPLFKGREHGIHSIAASVCAAAALLWIILTGYGIVAAILLLPSVLAAVKWKKACLFFLELWMFVSSYVTLFFLI